MSIKKTLALILALMMVVSLFAACKKDSGESTELVIYTWEGMFDPEAIAAFEAETGIKVTLTTFVFNEDMYEKLKANNAKDYDLVICDDYMMEQIALDGLAQKLDKSKIENYQNINTFYQNQYYDPNDEYSIPFGAGVVSIVYNPAEVTQPINGFADLTEPSLVDEVGIIANYRVIVSYALATLGYDFNSENLDEIADAGNFLANLAPNIRLIKDEGLNDDLVSGEIAAALVYQSQMINAVILNPSLEVVYPEEITGFGIMPLFIPANAKHADAAYKFINYMLQPEVGASMFEYLGYYCTFAASEPYINEDYAQYLILPDSLLTSGHTDMIKNINDEANEKCELVWNEFYASCGY